MGDMLRRATSHGDDDQSPDGDDQDDHDHDDHMYSGQYTPEHRRDGVVSDPKKRKRNFSNRTKTGCLTCRRRKKKCDEQKPECEFSPAIIFWSLPVPSALLWCTHAHGLGLRPHPACSSG